MNKKLRIAELERENAQLKEELGKKKEKPKKTEDKKNND